MRTLRIHKPSPALVISIIALFLALGGTSYAAITLPAKSVGTKQLMTGAVTTPKIKKGAVTAVKINTTGLNVPYATTGGHHPREPRAEPCLGPTPTRVLPRGPSATAPSRPVAPPASPRQAARSRSPVPRPQ